MAKTRQNRLEQLIKVSKEIGFENVKNVVEAFQNAGLPIDPSIIKGVQLAEECLGLRP